MAAPADSTFALRQLVEELAVQLRAGVDKLGDLPQETGERIARELGSSRGRSTTPWRSASRSSSTA